VVPWVTPVHPSTFLLRGSRKRPPLLLGLECWWTACLALNQFGQGSTPCGPTEVHSGVAQLAEREAVNFDVVGSNPTARA
jgi:hypothetical protein